MKDVNMDQKKTTTTTTFLLKLMLKVSVGISSLFSKE